MYKFTYYIKHYYKYNLYKLCKYETIILIINKSFIFLNISN